MVQILSFGQSEMTSLFETNKAVNARVFVRLALPPLTLASALQMVFFRLRVAGRNEALINDNAFELLYEHSQGVPARDHPPLRAWPPMPSCRATKP